MAGPPLPCRRARPSPPGRGFAGCVGVPSAFDDRENRFPRLRHMPYAQPMFRLFDLFGKSAALKAVDAALRGAGVHPALVPEAVKLTLLRLSRESATPEATTAGAARLLAYCILGHQGFAEANEPDAAHHEAQRLDAATEAGDSRDARVVLLALHAGLLAPEIADRIEVDDG